MTASIDSVPQGRSTAAKHSPTRVPFFGKEYFTDRTRFEFGLKKFRKYFGTKVLDVGAGGGIETFRRELGTGYFALDVSDSRAHPDLLFDFEKVKLPFKDSEFDTVVCLDCLEHCDNIHGLFDELLRVSKNYVIVSLPNNWVGFHHSVFSGKNITHKMGYGLPEVEPSRGFRHKWWYNLEEAARFIRYRVKQSHAEIAEMKFIFEPWSDTFLSIPGLYPDIFKIHPSELQRFSEADLNLVENRGTAARFFQKLTKFIGFRASYAVFMFVRNCVGQPIRLLDEGIKRLVWGWGEYRYLNLFCRQLWAVIDVSKSKNRLN